MTKKLNLSVLAILVVTFLFTTSCVKENELSNNDTFNRTFEIKSNKTNKRSLTNYQINANSNIDFANQQINLEFPVSLNDFHFAKAYNVSTADQPAILVIISRDSNDVVNDLPASYMVNTNISFNEVNLDADSLINKENLNIFVMNNVRALDDNDAIIEAFRNQNATSFNKSTSKNDSTDGPWTNEDGLIIINSL